MEEAESTQHLSLGEFLQHAREKSGMSLEYAADCLKLKVSTVKALETDNYQDLGGLVYVKGYLRSYAKLLYVNIDQALDIITDSYDLQNNKKTAGQNAGSARNTHFSETLGIGLTVAVLLAVIVIAFFWHHRAQVKNTPVVKSAAVVDKLPAPVVNQLVVEKPSVNPVVTPALMVPVPVVPKLDEHKPAVIKNDLSPDVKQSDVKPTSKKSTDVKSADLTSTDSKSDDAKNTNDDSAVITQNNSEE